MAEIDYRAILVEYIEHVNHTEGADFLAGGIDSLSLEQNIALLECGVEARREGAYRDRLREDLDALKTKKPAQR